MIQQLTVCSILVHGIPDFALCFTLRKSWSGQSRFSRTPLRFYALLSGGSRNLGLLYDIE